MRNFINVMFIFLLSTALTVHAKKSKKIQYIKSLESILSQNGSININDIAEGAYNTDDYKMILGKKGEPIFVKKAFPSPEKADGDEYWDDRFYFGGIDGVVLAMAVDSSDNIYIGGTFTEINNTPCAYIAQWDGESWSPVGSGFDNTVFTLTAFGDKIYAGGAFNNAGDVVVNKIAVWDGSSWNAFGTGMNDTVFSIAVSVSLLHPAITSSTPNIKNNFLLIVVFSFITKCTSNLFYFSMH